MSKASSAYKNTSIDSKILGESPHGIVKMLLEKLNENLIVSYEIIQNAKNPGTNEFDNAIVVTKKLKAASDIVHALSRSLIKRKDDDGIFDIFSGLYDYMQYQIFKANMQDDSKALEDVIKIAGELLETWNMIPEDFYYATR